MTIVLFIMLAFLAMSVPFFANFNTGMGLSTSEREIKTVLRTARSYAITQNTSYNAIFTGPTGAPPNRFWIQNNAGQMQDKGYDFPRGVTLNTAAAITTVSFTANGGLTVSTSAISTVGISITDNKGKAKTVVIDAVTGAVE